MKVAVLGGAGFIGSHLTDKLVSRSSRVLVLDDLSSGSRSNVNAKADFGTIGVCEPGLYDEVLAWGRPDVMVLLAAQTSVSRSCAEPLTDAQTNILGLINVIRTSIRLGVSQIVFSSSAAVYGEPMELPISENHSMSPQSPYAISKFTGELYMKNMVQPAGTAMCIMRFSNVYGPRQRSDGEAGVVSIFADRFVRSQRVTVYGDGSQTRDFIYVGDVAEALVRAIEVRAHGTFNISTNTSASIMDLHREMSSITGYRAPVEFQPARLGDILQSRLSNRRAMEALGWEPRIRLRDGLERTIQSLRKTDLR